MKKILILISTFFFSLGCSIQTIETEEEEKIIDSIINHSNLILERSQNINNFTDSSSAYEIRKMREKILKMDFEIKELKNEKNSQIPRKLKNIKKNKEIFSPENEIIPDPGGETLSFEIKTSGESKTKIADSTKDYK